MALTNRARVRRLSNAQMQQASFCSRPATGGFARAPISAALTNPLVFCPLLVPTLPGYKPRFQPHKMSIPYLELPDHTTAPHLDPKMGQKRALCNQDDSGILARRSLKNGLILSNNRVMDTLIGVGNKKTPPAIEQGESWILLLGYAAPARFLNCKRDRDPVITHGREVKPEPDYTEGAIYLLKRKR